jgi:TIR domain
MADIFISYASQDRDRAKALADALAAQGSSVWWDRVIPPGRVFDEVIEEALRRTIPPCCISTGTILRAFFRRSKRTAARKSRRSTTTAEAIATSNDDR